MAIFAIRELNELVDALSTERNFETSAVTVVGALVIAARGLPLDVIQALVPAYVARERSEIGQATPPAVGDTSQ